MSNIHNISIEQCTLAALMTVQNSYETVMGDLTVDCFHSTKHQEIFKAIATLAENNKPYDIIMVEQQLNQSKSVFDATEYLMTMMTEAPSSFYNLESYVAELVKFKNHREVEAMGRSIQETAKDLSITDIHNAAENILSQSASTDKSEKTSFTFEEALKRAGDQLIQKAEAKAAKKYTGVKFNLPHLDNLIGTIQKGHFCVIGGRPGSGKSTLAQMVAIQTAMQFGEAVLVVSAEMDVETFTNRCISALTHIPFENIHNAEIEGMLHTFVEAQSRFSKLPIHIEDKQKPTIAEIHAYARKAKRNYKKLGCIIVDYLQLVRDPTKKDRYQEVSSISRDLKALAKEFDCPVIALAQLNRESEKGKRPKPSDLKESGQIEQDADQILLVNPVVDPNEESTGITEIIVGKNRHGKKGIARVVERLDICRFMGIQEDVA
ncbi:MULTISPECIES: replicative DNA helicase [unclassified Acinetobacter]|uniref:replicative DNA helicase n=1 Tax=unclassified Acinetobacter TaxID=196816 RepID=UPI0029348B03|nr:MULTISPECIES: DnaB-like helicase C-terminal domain-containing protein [unclassified Acinetobacter]WOE32772.1 DnaB-like helicase C-terminal domain-containing protein [Acinetobacter sp. SAAs470]WOE38249.1 DnaB-like helicase C-terminal domain-containing protein [Acinetobacter sp. SAAs474]